MSCKASLIRSRMSFSKGHLPYLPHGQPHVTPGTDPEEIGAPLKFQLACQNLVTRCTTAVAELGLDNLSHDLKRALNIILRSFDEQLDIIESHSSLTTSHQDNRSVFTTPLFIKFIIVSTRLNMSIFHVFKETHVSVDGPLARLLTTACTTVELIEELCNTGQLASSPPYFVMHSAILASCCILRIVNTPSSSTVDVDNATKLLTLGINRAKLISVHPSDLCARSSLIMTQLLKEPNTFRHPDGSPDLTVRVRNRLAAGVILDIISRWFDVVDKSHTKSSLPNAGTYDGK